MSKYRTNNCCDTYKYRGPVGLPGPQGLNTGFTGATGPKGTNGLAGPTGSNGLVGPTGLAGSGTNILPLNNTFSGLNTFFGALPIYSGNTGPISETQLVTKSYVDSTNYWSLTDSNGSTTPIYSNNIRVNQMDVNMITFLDGSIQISSSDDKIYTYNVSSIWTKIINDKFNCCAISSTGQYQIAGSTNKLYISTNYGTSWRNIQSSNIINCCISGNGKYQAYCLKYIGTVYTSNNYGTTWTTSSISNSSRMSFSISGQYQIIGIYYSSNYGSTWFNNSNLPYEVNSMSGTGQYQIAIDNITGSTVYISNNYGNTWTIVSSSLLADNQTTYYRSAISGTGQYQTILESQRIYISNDYGQTWSMILSTSISSNTSYILISYSGQFQLGLFTMSGNIFNTINYSQDYGQTWFSCSQQSQYWSSVSMSSLGEYCTTSSNDNTYIGLYNNINLIKNIKPFNYSIYPTTIIGSTGLTNPLSQIYLINSNIEGDTGPIITLPKGSTGTDVWFKKILLDAGPITFNSVQPFYSANKIGATGTITMPYTTLQTHFVSTGSNWLQLQ